MKMALAFTSTIKNSKVFEQNFADVIQSYKDAYPNNDGVKCEVRHVDGTMRKGIMCKNFIMTKKPEEKT